MLKIGCDYMLKDLNYAARDMLICRADGNSARYGSEYAKAVMEILELRMSNGEVIKDNTANEAIKKGKDMAEELKKL
jgi:hypothetical protein